MENSYCQIYSNRTLFFNAPLRSPRRKSNEWRKKGYASPDHPAIAEILDYAWLTPGEQPRALRLAQIRALETYWYLRLIEDTPHIMTLYKQLFLKKRERATALGIEHPDLREMLIDFTEPGGNLDRLKQEIVMSGSR